MYATLAELKKKLPADVLVALTDDGGSGVIDTAIIDADLKAADVEIDGYLGGRYTLPLSPLPEIVIKLAVDITIYNLYGRRQGPPEHWQKRYDNAVRYLVKVAGGSVSLGLGDPEAPAADEAMITSSARIFSRETLKGF